MNRKIIIAVLLTVTFFAARKEDSKGSGLKSKAPVFQAPSSPRATFNFNPGWRFSFGDTTGADQPGFDDAKWASVSLPHTWNEMDTYRAYISHSGGDQSEKMFGIGWYRKHFKLPAGSD